MELNDTQKEAIQLALNNSFICSVTGSAGTGKSTIISEVYNKLTASGKTVEVICPTGRAANLLRTKMGVGKTIHKFLEYFTQDNGLTYKPKYGTLNTIPVDYVIIDEASMVNREVWDNLLKALPNNCKLLLVGDPNQLPPIEQTPQESAFRICLRRYPVVELKQRYRFGKQAVLSKLSDDVLEGNFAEIVKSGLLYRLDGVTDEKIINKLASEEKYHSINAQVICPVYKGKTGCDYINRMFQLHRWGTVPSGFHEGDKIIVNINTDLVTNGDILFYKGMDDSYIHFTEKSIPRYFTPARGVCIDMLTQMKLAYAITTHKSQGGEYHDVVYIVGKTAFPVLNRANIYTGVTRSSENLVVLYDQYIFRKGLSNVDV